MRMRARKRITGRQLTRNCDGRVRKHSTCIVPSESNCGTFNACKVIQVELVQELWPSARAGCNPLLHDRSRLKKKWPSINCHRKLSAHNAFLLVGAGESRSQGKSPAVSCMARSWHLWIPGRLRPGVGEARVTRWRGNRSITYKTTAQ